MPVILRVVCYADSDQCCKLGLRLLKDEHTLGHGILLSKVQQQRFTQFVQSEAPRLNRHTDSHGLARRSTVLGN
eukprot:6051428-Pleurochrysis_carterae.AAC.1